MPHDPATVLHPQTSWPIDVRILTTTTTVTEISNSSGNAVVATLDTEATVQVTFGKSNEYGGLTTIWSFTL